MPQRIDVRLRATRHDPAAPAPREPRRGRGRLAIIGRRVSPTMAQAIALHSTPGGRELMRREQEEQERRARERLYPPPERVSRPGDFPWR